MTAFNLTIEITEDTGLPFHACRFVVKQHGPQGEVVVHETRAAVPSDAEQGIADAYQEAEMVAGAVQAALSAAMPDAEVYGSYGLHRLPTINQARALFGLGAL